MAEPGLESGDRVELGRFNGAWGTAGWVKVFSLTEPAENIFEYQPWRAEASPGFFHVREWRRQGPRLVARLDEVASRDQAEALRGVALFIRRAEMPPVESGSWYWHDLIGLAVINRQGAVLGEVSGLLDAGVHDVLEVRSDRTGPGLLVPFVLGHFIDNVDLDAGRIIVDWQPDWTDAD